MRALGLIPLVLVIACSDPVRDSKIDSLPSEVPGIPQGPLHRAGQPCVLCHGGAGPGEMEFEFGGTVYQKEGEKTPLVGAIIHFRDSEQKDYKVATNCAGNFFVVKGDYEPAWPVFVKLEYSGVIDGTAFSLKPVMHSPIFKNDSPLSGLRDSSCAYCHGSDPGPSSVGSIFLLDKSTNVPLPQVPCP